MYIASFQCLLHFGWAFSAGSIYPRYIILYKLHKRVSVLAHIGISFFSQQKCGDFQIQRASEGFQVSGSPDPEAKCRVCLALEVTLQQYVKSNCTRSSTVFCHQRTAESTVLRDWSLLIPGTGAEGNIIFSPKDSCPIQISLQIFIPQYLQAFYVLIIFTIFKNPIKKRFKHKHLTATYSLIALNLKESSHRNYVQY